MRLTHNKDADNINTVVFSDKDGLNALYLNKELFAVEDGTKIPDAVKITWEVSDS